MLPPNLARLTRRWPLVALAALLLVLTAAVPQVSRVALSQSAPTVTGVEVTSDPGDDDTYDSGDEIEIQLTFSEAMSVSGTPRLTIKMDPDYGEKWAEYESGSGAANLTFAYEVEEPNISTEGIAVLENTLELNGGTVQSVSSGTNAALAHTGLDHDDDHLVDWRPKPSVTGVAVTSDPGDDDTYVLGDEIHIRLTFSEAVSVSGTPRLTLKMDPDFGEKWAEYKSGSGAANLTFAYEVEEPNISTDGIAVLANTLELNGGTLRSARGRDAALAHTGLDHDANHRVDWQRPEPEPAREPRREPTKTSRTRRAPPPPEPTAAPEPTATPNIIGSTAAATASELPGNRLLIQRHDVPDTSVEVVVGSISADGTTVVPAGVVRESPLGQTYLVLRRESDGRIVRRWVPFYSRLAGQIPWPIVNARYTFPTSVIITIPLDDEFHRPYILVRRFDGDDDRIFAFDPTVRQWRHVPDIPTFQSLLFYWCDVISADAGFFERLAPGPAYPPSLESARSDYPVCRTGQPEG